MKKSAKYLWVILGIASGNAASAEEMKVINSAQAEKCRFTKDISYITSKSSAEVTESGEFKLKGLRETLKHEIAALEGNSVTIAGSASEEYLMSIKLYDCR